MGKITKTLKVRIKDKHAQKLRVMSGDVNFVWNYLNELSSKIIEREHRFPSAYDMQKYITGASREGFSILADTMNCLCEHYVVKRKASKKRRLAWRSSKKSLGWVPFKKGCVRVVGNNIVYLGSKFSFWDSYGLSAYKIKSGSFSEDARGRWYFCANVETIREVYCGEAIVGIDLGLKNLAVLSNGLVIKNNRWYRSLEPKLSTAQKANKKKLVRGLNAKIANQRKDFLHKAANELVKDNGAIIVGNVNSAKLAKTRMAKSVNDASWSMFRNMLSYKCQQAGAYFLEVDEANTTLSCSSCGCTTGPRGFAGLEIREWTCIECGVSHDRDINAAKNILRLGHQALVAGAAQYAEMSTLAARVS